MEIKTLKTFLAVNFNFTISKGFSLVDTNFRIGHYINSYVFENE